jgi:hypothetical protein
MFHVLHKRHCIFTFFIEWYLCLFIQILGIFIFIKEFIRINS